MRFMRFSKKLVFWFSELLPLLLFLLILLLFYGMRLFNDLIPGLEEKIGFRIIFLLIQLFVGYSFYFNSLLVFLCVLSLWFVFWNIKHGRFKIIKHPISFLVIILTLIFVGFSSISSRRLFYNLSQQLNISVPAKAKIVAFYPSFKFVGTEDIYYIEIVMKKQDTERFLSENNMPQIRNNYTVPLDTGYPLSFWGWRTLQLKGLIISGQKDCGTPGNINYST